MSENPLLDLSRDFGGFLHGAPAMVLHARSEEDVARAVCTAAKLGISLTVRGAGHSSGGQCLNTGGLTLVNDDVASHPRFLNHAQVELSARSRWRSVAQFLHGEGRALPVLTSHLDTSVGGTLSSGGFGLASIRYGAQIDHVDQLRIVLRSGATVECSRTNNPDIFALALGGSGGAGVIESAVLATIPFHPWTRFIERSYDSLPEIARALEPLASGEARPDYFFAEKRGEAFVAAYGQGLDASDAAEVDAQTRPERSARGWVCRTESLFDFEPIPVSEREFCHIWADYCFDFAGLLRFAERVSLGLDLGVIRPYLTRIYLLALAPPPQGRVSPFDPRPDDSQVTFGIGLYYNVPASQLAAIARTRSIQDSLCEHCLELGGRPYRSGYCHLNSAIEERLYGNYRNRLGTAIDKLNIDVL